MSLHETVANGIAESRIHRTSIQRIDAKNLTPDVFLQNYILTNTPVIIQNAINNWPALSLWTNNSYFSNLDTMVTVNFTPDGHGDALVNVYDTTYTSKKQTLFVKPQERKMLLKDAVQLIESKNEEYGIPYISSQDDCVRRETPYLLHDIKPLVFSPYQQEKAEAINLWIGDERNVSTMHKDNYDNFMSVIVGEKVFYLNPPGDAMFMYMKDIPTSRYSLQQEKTKEWRIEIDEQETISLSSTRKKNVITGTCLYNTHNVSTITRRRAWQWIQTDEEIYHTKYTYIPWISVDPIAILEKDTLAINTWPLYAMYATPEKVSVYAGETLFLPALWHHTVTQSTFTIAINEWYDVNRYTYPEYELYSLARALGPLVEASYVTRN